MSTTETIYFVHLTDIHISVPGKSPLFGLNTAEKLRKAFADIAGLRMNLFYVISGDLTMTGTCRIIGSLGRCSTTRSRSSAFPSMWRSAITTGASRSGKAFSGKRRRRNPIITALCPADFESLCSTRSQDSHAGRIDDEQLIWLKNLLAEPAPIERLLSIIIRSCGRLRP